MDNKYGKSIQKNLRRVLYEKEMTAADLSRAMGVPSSTVSFWMNGKRTPRGDMMDRLCAVLRIDPRELLTESKHGKAMRVPVLGYVAAGIPIEMVEDAKDYEDLDPRQFDPSYDYFALIIRGDSMAPKIDDGDIVIVRKQETVDTGQLAIVAVNGDNATCKRVKKYRDGIELIPENPHYEPIFYSNDDIRRLPVTIIGLVVEARTKFV